MKEAERTKATEEIEQWKINHGQTKQEMHQLADGQQQAKAEVKEESGGGITRYDADDETDCMKQNATRNRKNQKKISKQQPQKKSKGERSHLMYI